MKILVADDHPLVREWFCEALRQMDADVLLLEAENARQTKDAVGSNTELDLVVLDLFMPGARGFDLLSMICAAASRTPVVVLSASDEPENIRKAFDCGAAGYIPKSSPKGVILSAIRLVLSGGVYVPERLIRPEEEAREQARGAPWDAGLRSALTHRQLEVLACMCRGGSNKEIAHELGLAENTVKVHVAAILRALNAHNRTEAVVTARQMGFEGTRSGLRRAPTYT